MATKKAAKKKAPAKKKAATKKTPARKTVKKAAKSSKKTEPNGKCFVMMPFSAPFNVYYDNVYYPAIEEAGMSPVRADDLFRAGVIVADLWAMIQAAKVLLAELTTKNPNVFYELGLAHAIGKPIVLVSETMNDVPFDLQQLRVLLYDKDDPAWGQKLRQAITIAIKETIASPVDAVPNIFRKKVESQAPEQDEIISRMESVETELRQLRSRTITPPPYRAKVEGELREVKGPADLKRWVRRWREIIEVDELEALVNRLGAVPSEAFRDTVLSLEDSD